MPEKGVKTYSEYNYLRPGVASFLRTRHFEYALRLTKDYFHKCNVIDFGCADGPFLPSLAKYFNGVVAIDKNPKFVDLASKVVSARGLKNVKLICNSDLTLDDVRSRIGSERHHILYLLETLEHVGDKSNLWESKVNFVKELFDLIDERGIIVISVPNMVGIPFLLQRHGFFLLGANREPISKTNLFRASFFNDTSDLEEQWRGGHLGFNHKKLESHLEKEFCILKRKNVVFQLMYICQRSINNG
ncbi:class I SAM-dependent methyltransferase [Dehalococcoidia bacterium]|nr:class I SAM-dependent methyltransferase [Dehalococcoidia bacterium]